MRAALWMVFLSGLVYAVRGRVPYVPAQIVIPTLNISTVHILRNATVNRTETPNRVGWNNPLLNKTGEQSFNQTNANGDLIVGRIFSIDRRLFQQVYRKERRWWSGRKKIIQYPNDLPGSYGRRETISAIRAYNRFYDGLNSKAEIVAGGVGRRYAKIKLSSGWGFGFEYTVVIYGH